MHTAGGAGESNGYKMSVAFVDFRIFHFLASVQITPKVIIFVGGSAGEMSIL